MAEITAKMVADLRAKTGCGMMDCKKALKESDGDVEQAVKYLREKGLSVAAKKADRIAAEGIVDIMLSEDGKTAAMVEVNAETDFVAKNETFQAFVKEILKTILAEKPADVNDLLTKKMAGTDTTVEQALKDKIYTIGENMSIRRFVIVNGTLSTYIHGKGTTGVIVSFDADDKAVSNEGFAEMAKNVALQVAAMNCQYVDRDSVPASVLDEEKEVIAAQLKNDPKNASKPANIIEKMLTGKLGKFYETYCLADQAYVKDDSMTVAKYIDTTAKSFGGNAKLKAFYRFEKGEGLQKREENFADEIASMIK